MEAAGLPATRDLCFARPVAALLTAGAARVLLVVDEIVIRPRCAGRGCCSPSVEQMPHYA